ncbi:Mur ligase family protein [Mycobacterium tuberculosis GM 1503]|nr:Mur ligase family protein [Mycobacterium tuberculosis GM 1503]
MVTTRARLALAAGAGARWASRVTGRGAGAMIGGLVAMTLDRSILRQLGMGRRTVVVTGTNGKSTTTRMTAAALGTLGAVATNAEGANMDAGLVAALAAHRDAELAVLEVDEMHVPHISDAVDPAVVVLLNLSRDQLDRVGEINVIERTLRAGLARHPDAVVVANCDDVLMTSAALPTAPTSFGWPAGGAWSNDSVSCPRSGEVIVRKGPLSGRPLVLHRRRLQAARPALVVRRRHAVWARRAGAADAAGTARLGESRQRRPSRGRRSRPRRRSGCGRRRRLPGRRGRRTLPDRSYRRAPSPDPAGQKPGRLAGSAGDGRQACRRGGHRGQRAGS